MHNPCLRVNHSSAVLFCRQYETACSDGSLLPISRRESTLTYFPCQRHFQDQDDGGDDGDDNDDGGGDDDEGKECGISLVFGKLSLKLISS